MCPQHNVLFDRSENIRVAFSCINLIPIYEYWSQRGKKSQLFLRKIMQLKVTKDLLTLYIRSVSTDLISQYFDGAINQTAVISLIVIDKKTSFISTRNRH